MDFDHAIMAHAEWRLKFTLAIGRQEQIDVAHVDADDCCTLGVWLKGDAGQLFGKLPAWADCVRLHEQFHHEASKVAATINGGHYYEAENMLLPGSSYCQASNELTGALNQLRDQAGL
ncbi:CZB domain-containing protein [Chitiniphilus eburneus]|uniref:Chemotaxis protein n=1 Tax=Chitiniphilus eburneus TaxID=2571148 RepID=A0A4U0PWT4_9NEIS|nr:CZB domain-containing protein [Chitiniphilus eburneus]TJZ73005.1 chemotaxis protein [Chitiniphilus eburneus]